MQVMFVDDERIIRDGLKTMIAWQELGFTHLTEARNALQALERIAEEPPDLIVTDIVMPEMSGIEFVRQVKSLHRDVQVIILSGYEKFEYAREAVQLGVAEYLVKPVYPSELYDVVRAVARSIRQQRMEAEWKTETNQQLHQYRSQAREAFWADVVQGKLAGALETERRMEELAIVPPPMPLCCLMIRPDRKEAIERFGENYLSLIQFAVRNITEEVAGEEGAVIVNLAAPDLMGLGPTEVVQAAVHRIWRSIDKTLGIACYIGIGRSCAALPELAASMDEAFEAADSIALLGERGIIFYEEMSKRASAHYPYEQERQLMRGLGLEATSLRAGVQAFVEAIQRQQTSAVERRMCYVQLLSAVYRRADEWGVAERLLSFKEQFQNMMAADAEQEIAASLEKVLIAITDCRQEQQAGHTEQVILKAKRIIEADYADSELSVGRLADELHITPNYLSRLFHRITGQTVSEYMTSVRLGAASELLRQTPLKVFEVAERVGYTNSHYFSMVFKKHTGMTPVSYRERDGGGL